MPTDTLRGRSDGLVIEPPRPVVRSSGGSAAALIILAVLATAYTLAIARPFLLPLTFAWLAKAALAPVIRVMQRCGLPAPLGAALTVVTLTALLIGGLYQLSAPAAEWAERLPRSIETVREIIRESSGGDQNTPSAIESVSKASEAVSELADSTLPDAKPMEVAVVAGRSSLSVLGGLWDFGANLLVTLVLLYFMLSTGDVFLTRLADAIPRPRAGEATVLTIRAIEAGIARYLGTAFMINACIGLAVGTTCWLFALPNPLLWGVVAAGLNFVPYVGALCGVAILAVVGLTTLPDLGSALAPAAIYAIVNGVEGMIITPIILGRQLTLSPVVLFAWLLFMGWIWGVPGALVAVPLLAAAKIACDHIPRLQVLGRFLGA